MDARCGRNPARGDLSLIGSVMVAIDKVRRAKK